MTEEPLRPEDVEATGIFLRVMAKLAPEFAVKVLLSADIQSLAQALAEVRSRERRHGYDQALRDVDNGTVELYNVNPDAPTWAELMRIRGETYSPDALTDDGIVRPDVWPRYQAKPSDQPEHRGGPAPLAGGKCNCGIAWTSHPGNSVNGFLFTRECKKA